MRALLRGLTSESVTKVKMYPLLGSEGKASVLFG
jgi:hypothetical protein